MSNLKGVDLIILLYVKYVKLSDLLRKKTWKNQNVLTAC